MQAVQDKLHQTVAEQLMSASSAPHALAPNTPLPGVCAALSIIGSLEDVSPGIVLDKFTQPMLRQVP